LLAALEQAKNKASLHKSNLQAFHKYFTEQASPPPCEHFDKDHIEAIDETMLISSRESQYDLEIHVDICDSVITEEEVAFHLRKLKNNKAAGVDGIPASINMQQRN
jgi:hypothetical protein